jgi:hypothetical protein
LAISVYHQSKRSSQDFPACLRLAGGLGQAAPESARARHRAE